MRTRLRKRFDHGEPISKIDTRPLVFIAMFLAIVFVMPAGQVRPHSFDIELWNGQSAHPLIGGSEDRRAYKAKYVNRVTLTAHDQLLWNDHPIYENQLRTLLKEVQAFHEPPIVEFAPDGNAGYDRAVKTLYLIRQSGAHFRIAEMEEHCQFDSGRNRWRAGNGPRGVYSLALSIHIGDLDDTLLEYAEAMKRCDSRPAVHAPD